MWRLSRSKGAHAYACEIVRFATVSALQGKKSGRCSHLGSDHELGTEVQKGRVYTHPKQADLSERFESQDGLVEWEQGNWAEAYVSWRRTHNLVIPMWTSTVCGNATEASSQAEIYSMSIANPGKQMTLCDPLRQINHRKRLKIHFKNFCRIVTGSRQRRWPTPFGASRSCQQEPLAGCGYVEGCVEYL